MRYIVVLMLVLWAGTGWAEEETETWLAVPQGFIVTDKAMMLDLIDEATRNGGMLQVGLYEYDEQQQVWNRARPPFCLARMQAAMTAMEPFLPDGESNIMLTDQYGNYALHPNSHWVGIPEHEVPALRDALAEWKSVRRDCWQ